MLRTLERLFFNYRGHQSCLGLIGGTSIITRSLTNEVENKEQGGGCWSEQKFVFGGVSACPCPL